MPSKLFWLKGKALKWVQSVQVLAKSEVAVGGAHHVGSNMVSSLASYVLVLLKWSPSSSSGRKETEDLQWVQSSQAVDPRWGV